MDWNDLSWDLIWGHCGADCTVNGSLPPFSGAGRKKSPFSGGRIPRAEPVAEHLQLLCFCCGENSVVWEVLQPVPL